MLKLNIKNLNNGQITTFLKYNKTNTNFSFGFVIGINFMLILLIIMLCLISLLDKPVNEIFFINFSEFNEIFFIILVLVVIIITVYGCVFLEEQVYFFYGVLAGFILSYLSVLLIIICLNYLYPHILWFKIFFLIIQIFF